MTATTSTAPVRGPRRPFAWAGRRIWVWAVLAAILLWLLACLLTGRFSLQLLLVNATLATFLALAGVAQMTVITSGDGSFDLSLPYVITFTAILSAGVVTHGAGDGLGIVLALVAGMAIGAVTGILISALRMPAVIASLSVGYIVYSLVLAVGSSGSDAASQALGGFLKIQFGGAGMLLAVGIVVGVLVAVLLTATVYGRWLHAMGQSREAAKLAGIPVTPMVIATFALSGLLAAVVGILLAAYNGGAFQNIGNVYLLGSVAAVVVGGVPVSGGRSSVPATMVGALVMTLLITVLDVSGLGSGMQYIVQGVAVIVIVVLAQAARARGDRA